MRWPWPRRRDANGVAAQAAKQDAAKQLREATIRSPQVDRLSRAANELARRTDRLALEIERAMRLREAP